MSTALAPSVTTRDPKGQKFVSIIEAAYNKAGLSEDEAQRVNDTPGLAELVGGFIVENRKVNRFKDEEVSSNYTYPKEYQGPRPIKEQIKTLAKIFNLNPSHALEFAKNLSKFPEGAEGWFAISSVDALASQFFPEVSDSTERYCRAVNLVFKKINNSRDFQNYREDQITPNRLRVHARTAHTLDLIAEIQKGDILIIAAQLGLRHRGRSVRRAHEVFTQNEFGLGSFAIGSIILTHPERLVRYDELDMDCPGDEFSPDEFSPDAVGDFSHAPLFFFVGGGVGFGADRVGRAHDHYGSASAFLPQ